MKRGRPETARRFQRDLSATTESHRFTVGDSGDGQRLDRFLDERLSFLSRSQLKELIEAGRVRIAEDDEPTSAGDARPPRLAEPDGRKAPGPRREDESRRAGRLRPSTRLRRGQWITLELDTPWVEAGAVPAEADEIPILFEDAALLAVSKPPGVAVHPTSRHRAGSLLERLHRRHAESGATGPPPSPCHRLDRETSGLVLFARTPEARAAVGGAIERGRLRKRYLALVRGEPDAEGGEISTPIGPAHDSRVPIRQAVLDSGGRAATTLWRVLHRHSDCTLLELEPITGRKHQLRVHLASIGHPILGDRLYLGGDELFLATLDREPSVEETARLGHPRLALHAWRLELPHPSSGEPLALEAPPWPDLAPWIFD